MPFEPAQCCLAVRRVYLPGLFVYNSFSFDLIPICDCDSARIDKERLWSQDTDDDMDTCFVKVAVPVPGIRAAAPGV